LALCVPIASATTWYVNGISGSNTNTCLSPTTACKTIKHAISLAVSGDSIIVAAATYKERLTIGKNLKILGSGAPTTIIDGGGVNTVVTISNTSAHVTLSKLTVRNGHAGSGTAQRGGGISNVGTLSFSDGTVSGNFAGVPFPMGGGGLGGGIYNTGALTMYRSTVNGNVAGGFCPGGVVCSGGGIYNIGTLIINNSTLTGNVAVGEGGGISNSQAGFSAGHVTISNSTLSGNTDTAGHGGGIFNGFGQATLQNSIVANNSGGNCSGTIFSHGYNLSSDSTCKFSDTGDLNNTNPLLGTLGYYGGPTRTIPLLSGSPAIDSGNPSGCTDGQGHLLKTDQRGKPRPDTEDTGGCDMGAYERQSD
jgi:hypothetical protein